MTLLTDPDSAVAARDLKTHVSGLIRHGQGGTLILDRVPKDQVVSKGDVIVTRGTVDRRYPDEYPYGIPIGRVRRRRHERHRELPHRAGAAARERSTRSTPSPRSSRSIRARNRDHRRRLQGRGAALRRGDRPGVDLRAAARVRRRPAGRCSSPSSASRCCAARSPARSRDSSRASSSTRRRSASSG